MRTKLSPWVILAILTLIGLIAAVISSGGLKSFGSGLSVGNQLTDDLIMQIYTDSPEIRYENFRVNGREDCPLISGDVAQGVSQRVLVSVSFDNSYWGQTFRNRSDMPIFLLRNGMWEIDPIWAHRCPNR